MNKLTDMLDCVWLILSDSHGDPRTNGPDGHFVYWSIDSGFEPINQIHDNAIWPDTACAAAAVQMALNRRGIHVPTVTLEIEEGAHSWGTTLQGVKDGFVKNGVNADILHADPPFGGYVGNPADGEKIKGDGLYLQATQHWIIVPEPLVVPNPAPKPIPSKESGTMWITKGVILLPNGKDGYTLDGWGGLHPIGSMPGVVSGAYWPGVDIARDAVLNPDGSGGYVLDGWGGIHPFAVQGHNPPPGVKGGGYWPGMDVAVQIVVTDWSKPYGYVIDGRGGQHPFGPSSTDEAPPLRVTAYWPNAQPDGRP